MFRSLRLPASVRAIRNATGLLPSVFFDFANGEYFTPIYRPNLTTLLDTARASAAWNLDWDFESGSEVGALTEYASDEARVSDRGLLTETSRTNQCTNPRFEGAETHIGASAALISGMGGFNPPTVVAAGESNGARYIDLRYTGASATSQIVRFQDTGTVLTADQSITASLSVELIAGDLTNVSYIGLSMRRVATVGGAVHIAQPVASQEPDETARRFIFAYETPIDASLFMEHRVVSTGAYDLTVRVWLPQMEIGASATSPILPPSGSPAAASRAADIPISDLSALADVDLSAPFSVWAKFQRLGDQQAAAFPYVWEIDDGSYSNVVGLWRATANGRYADIRRVPAQTVQDIATTPTGLVKAANRFTASGRRFAVNGVLSAGLESGPIPPGLNRALLGYGLSGGRDNWRILEWGVLPGALTDTQLGAITS